MSLDVDRVLAQADAIIASFAYADEKYPSTYHRSPPPLVPSDFGMGTFNSHHAPPMYHHSQRVAVPMEPSPMGPSHRSYHTNHPIQSSSSVHRTPTSDAVEWALHAFSSRRRSPQRQHRSSPAQSHSRSRHQPASSHHHNPPPIPSTTSSRPPRWSIDDFELGKKLGEGRFGKIYLARERASKCAVAIKCISKDIVAKSSLEEQIQREVDVHGLLHTKALRDSTMVDVDGGGSEEGGGEYVLRLLAYFWDSNVVYLVEEHADRGDLSRHLAAQPQGRLSEHHTKEVMRGLCAAVQYLHDRHILHRDIKSENILLKTKRCLRRGGTLPAGSFEYDVKLSDFTWAVQLPPVLRREDRRTTLCGTLDYLAPEVVRQEAYDYGVDMWGLGVVAYELLYGVPPFEHTDPTETCRRISRCEFHFPSVGDVSEKAQDFIKSLLIPDARGRMTAGQALYHPWLAAAPPQVVVPDESAVFSPSRALHHTVGDFTPFHTNPSGAQPNEVSETTQSEQDPVGDSATTTAHDGPSGGVSADTTYKGGVSQWTTHPNSTAEGSGVNAEGSSTNFSVTMKPSGAKQVVATATAGGDTSSWTPNVSVIDNEAASGGKEGAKEDGGSSPPSTNASYAYVHRVLDMEEGSTPAQSPIKAEAPHTSVAPADIPPATPQGTTPTQSLPSSLAGSIQEGLYSASSPDTPNSYSD